MASGKRRIQAVLVAAKVTKGAVKFVDQEGDSHLADPVHPYQLYLRHAQVQALGLPVAEGGIITMTVQPGTNGG